MLQILSLLINEEDAKWDLTFSIQRGVWHAPVSTQITDSAERNAIMSAPFTGKINTATRQVVNFPHYQKNISSSICIFKTFFNASVPLLDGIENIVAFLIHSYLLFTFLKLWLTTENWTCSFVFDNLILSDLTNTATFLCSDYWNRRRNFIFWFNDEMMLAKHWKKSKRNFLFLQFQLFNLIRMLIC